MGAAECSINQVRGKTIGGDGAAATGVSGVADGVGLEGGEGGRVTSRSMRAWETVELVACKGVRLRAGKDSGFECLR